MRMKVNDGVKVKKMDVLYIYMEIFSIHHLLMNSS